MMKKIVVKLTTKSLSKEFKISLDDEFADVFVADLNKIMEKNEFLDAARLLEAYIEKSYENFTLAKEIDILIKKN